MRAFLKRTPFIQVLRLLRRSIQRIYLVLNPHTPKGFIDSIDDWILADRKQSSLLEVQPRSQMEVVSPSESNLVYDIRVNSYEKYPLFQCIRWSVFAQVKLYFFQNFRIVGIEGVVLSSDNRIIKDFIYPPISNRWNDLSCFRGYGPAKPTKLSGWYATINYGASYNYFHWILECLPRMKFLADYLEILDGIIMPGRILPFHVESMRALGVEPDRFVSCSERMNIEIERLFVPKYFARDNPPRWLHKWYKETFLSTQISHLNFKPRIKIYVTRSDAGTRNCVNDDEVFSILEPHGFQKISLTGMPFLEQAKLFYLAEKIVAHHGAGLANLVFCREDTELLEIFSIYWMAPSSFALAKSVGMNYRFSVAESEAEQSKFVDNRVEVLDAEMSKEYRVDMTLFMKVASEFLD